MLITNLQRMVRELRILPLRLIFFLLMKTSILDHLGWRPSYTPRDFQKRKYIRNVLYLFCLVFTFALPLFSMLLQVANMSAAQKLVIYSFYGAVLFALISNTIFGDYFFLGNILVKVIDHKSFELHDTFQSTKPWALYSHTKNAVNELFRNDADKVIMNSHIFGSLTSLQVHRLGGLLSRRCKGVGCGLLGEPIPIHTISFLIGWTFGIPFRSRCRRKLVLLRSIDGFSPKENC
jgi:hypothetical protein